MPSANNSSNFGWLRKLSVIFLLVTQAGLSGYSATQHSPTDLEPAFLVSGLSHWQLGRFDLYRVNPPLVRMVAAIPIHLFGCETSWRHYFDNPGSRSEFWVEQDFIRENGASIVQLITFARWACIPFNSIGAYFAYLWAKELYGVKAGLTTLVLFIFEPNLLAHGELITPDSATTAFGIVSGYSFWRWLKMPSWERALLTGISLGLAELSKMSWLILFGLWPVIWLVWRWADQSKSRDAGLKPSLNQLLAIFAIAIYLINACYAFDGFGTRLKTYEFVSHLLSANQDPEVSGNIFRGMWLGHLPVPLPKQYVLGFDCQMRDLEFYRLPSYLRGEVRLHGGWWYYYLYGLLVKVPCGTWGVFMVVVLTRAIRRNPNVEFRDEFALLLPALVLIVVVSSQTEFNRHLRYVFPSLGLALIYIGQAGRAIQSRITVVGLLTSMLIVESATSTMLNYPHHLAYFNRFVGGSSRGHLHLAGSSLDWGQDLLFLKKHIALTGCEIKEIRGSYWKQDLVRVILNDVGPGENNSHKVIVLSANCVEQGKEIPANAKMLTPTIWIDSYDEIIHSLETRP